MALYNHYVVTNSKIEIQAINNTKDLLVSCYIDDDTTQTGEAEIAAERPGAVTMVVAKDNVSPILTKAWSAGVAFGPNVLNNELFRGSSSANPTEQSFFALSVHDPLLGASNIDFYVKITYTATFTELKTAGYS